MGPNQFEIEKDKVYYYFSIEDPFDIKHNPGEKVFNKCLNEKYSLNIDELCAPVITKAHAWRYPERSGSENSIESLEYPRCNTTV